MVLATVALSTLGRSSVFGAAEGGRPATIVLVRHAEKSGPTGDVGLSAVGQQRAQRLAAMLKDAEVRHIFTSDMIRTRDTAAPLARALGITAEALPATSVDALVAKLRALPAGAVALVVGHTNTVPQIAEKLGVAKVAPIAEGEYDRLLVLTRSADGTVRLLTLHY
jgi:phosphohistidine phosphatase SixA